MKEYPPCLQGRTIIPALLTLLLIIMFITAVATDQMIKGVYCSKNGTSTALQTIAALMSTKEGVYHSALAMTKTTAVKRSDNTGPGDVSLVRSWLINRKRNADIDEQGRNKGEKPVWGSTEEEMMRWKERARANSHQAPVKQVPSKPVPGSYSAFFSSYSSLALCSTP